MKEVTEISESSYDNENIIDDALSNNGEEIKTDKIIIEEDRHDPNLSYENSEMNSSIDGSEMNSSVDGSEMRLSGNDNDLNVSVEGMDPNSSMDGSDPNASQNDISAVSEEDITIPDAAKIDERYIAYDMEGRTRLQKAGFPASETAYLSEFYVYMKRLENELQQGNTAEPYKAAYDILRSSWNDIIDSAPVTAANHKTLKRKFYDCAKALNERAQADDFAAADSENNLREGFASLQSRMKFLVNKPLSSRDKTVMTATAKDLFDLLDSRNIDPGYVSSSSEFKAMKEALKKLSEVDRSKHPMQYEVLRDEALRCTRSYIAHKDAENTAGHKRSDLEARRVLTANTVLDSLNRMIREDIARENRRDKRIVVGSKMEPESARDFVKSCRLLDQSMENILNTLKDFKTSLKNTQSEADKDKNFENADSLCGSKYYIAMTQSLQKCIDLMSDKTSSFRDIQTALSKFKKCSATYYNERKGIFKGPRSPEGQTRLETSFQAVEKVSVFIPMIDSLRMNLDPYKTKGNMLFLGKNLKELGEKAAELSETFKDSLAEHPILAEDISFDKNYSISAKQLEIRKLIAGKNSSFTNGNYYINLKADYYPVKKHGASVSELAKDYITKKYLDSIYKSGISHDELNKIKTDIKNGEFDKDVKRLSTDPIFKSMSVRQPEKLYSKWNDIEKRASAIMNRCGKNIDKYHAGKGLGGPFETADDYINAAVSAELKKLNPEPRKKEPVYAIDPDEEAIRVAALKFDDLFPDLVPYKERAVREFQQKFGRLPVPNEDADETELLNTMSDMKSHDSPKRSFFVKKVPMKEVKAPVDEKPSPIVTVCSDVLTNFLLTDEKYGRILSEAIAADSALKPNDAINEIKKDVQDYVIKDIKKTKLHPKALINDPKKMEKVYKHVLENQKNRINARDMQPKAPALQNNNKNIANKKSSVHSGLMK